MEAILVIGHGSRSLEAQNEFNRVVNMVSEKSGAIVKGASMELCDPDIPSAVEELLNENPEIKVIKAVPLFLFEGIHIKVDIPEILEKKREKYPHVEFRFGKPIGVESLLADILIKRSEEI